VKPERNRAGSRRRPTLLLAALAAMAALCSVRAAQFSQHGPPWKAPVASSETFRVGGAAIQVDFAPGAMDLTTSQALQWVENAATAVATYYGRYPVARDRVLIEPRADDAGVMHGTTWGDVGGFPAFTRIGVGQHTTMADLSDDWMMTHELTHAAFPSQDDAQHWIEEGIAVYVEPVARVQAGFLTPERIWRDMVRDMPKGDPQRGDEGLDHTHTWGRTYWGGAQFCLMADVTLREQTHNRMGLEDALRAIMNAGGTIDRDWTIGKTLAAGDAGTGKHVLENLYEQMADKPVAVDLEGLWKKLGVVRTADGVRFDDTASEAEIRAAITKTPPWGRIGIQAGSREQTVGSR
jgi:hypothetical protein